MAKNTESFSGFLDQERERLTKAREEALANMAEIQHELESLDRELHAITVYERAKQGKLDGGGRAVGRRGGRRGEKREAVLQVIRQHPDGVSRGEILNIFGVKGDTSGEQSVSNSLTALKKANRVISRLGKYVAA